MAAPRTPGYQLDFRTASLSGSIITFTDGQSADILGTTSEVTLDSAEGVKTTSTSYLRIPQVPIYTEFTIELYVKIISHGYWHGFFSLSDGTSRDNMKHLGNFRNQNQLYIISSNGTYDSLTANIQNQGTSEDSETFYNLLDGPFDAHIVWTLSLIHISEPTRPY